MLVELHNKMFNTKLGLSCTILKPEKLATKDLIVVGRPEEAEFFYCQLLIF